MKREDVQAMYTRYAPHYNDVWHTGGHWAKESEYHLATLAELIDSETLWLDAGCGTGYYLSHFPGVRRVGLDLTPAMLEQARLGSPDAEEFRQGDLRDDIEEWHGRFDLVTSTGQAWTYVDTVDEVERVAENLAGWTAPGGRCFVQVVDIMDMVDCEVTYNFTGVRSGYETFVSGVVWSTYDGEATHANMVAPSLDQWVQWLSRHFQRIEIVRWPHDPPHPIVRVPRRSILASRKRERGDTTPAEIVEHPVPPVPGQEPAAAQTDDPLPGPGPLLSGEEGHDRHRREASSGLRGRVADIYRQPLNETVATYGPWKARPWKATARHLRRRLTR